MKKTPDIKPIKIKEYEVKQSDYDHVGKLPIRSLLIGPSGSGKTVLLQNMILYIYIKIAFQEFIYYRLQLM